MIPDPHLSLTQLVRPVLLLSGRGECVGPPDSMCVYLAYYCRKCVVGYHLLQMLTIIKVIYHVRILGGRNR